ncbi:hypothetical protein SKAU_G00236250 [Synaphobranchus kaupii]|uniref:PiggyBac transposable element-derived protein domain-containing protein n=1 Tax=Synaphobranchus kaupii TaxID=118154 RepID=A0A9Q1ITS5_SYNKA|nr:hypothetical protein SKAU_G00236250 [Synaphobranchus kaupii]
MVATRHGESESKDDDVGEDGGTAMVENLHGESDSEDEEEDKAKLEVQWQAELEQANRTATVQRWDNKRKETVQVKWPSIVITYNKGMGGVDLLDSLTPFTKQRDYTDSGIPKKEVYNLAIFKSEIASCLCMERKANFKRRGRPSQHC